MGESENDEIVPSKRRWPIIFVFACYSLSSAFQVLPMSHTDE